MLDNAERLSTPNGDEERFTLSNYVPKHLLQTLQQSLQQVLGVPLLFASWEGMPITRSEVLHTFCYRFTHKSRVTRPCSHCMRFSDIDLIGSGVEMERIPQPDDCPFGLSDIIVPIVIGDKIGAYMLTSQIMVNKGAREQAIKAFFDMGIQKRESNQFLSEMPSADLENIQRTESAINSIVDIVAATVSYAKYSRLAILDPLTGLFNRAYMWEYLNKKIDPDKSNEKPYSMLVFDLNELKSINNAYGYKAGDEVLRTVGHIIETSARTYDLAARFGGDSFVILLDNAGSRLARRVADRIVDCIENKEVQCGGNVIKIKASIGITDYAKNCCKTGEDVFKSADACLSRLKAQKKQ